MKTTRRARQLVFTAAFVPALSLALSGAASAQTPVSPITFTAGSLHFTLGG